MQITIELDDRLLDRARLISGIEETSALIHAGLQALIERQSAPVENPPRITSDQRAEQTISDS
ncbi:MAG: type II toxin-antitoxin system VapB family antitoxin [Gammaproteobacteria bacterium]|nr:type II toxin-antitoxin system VapB family antitoxin [Gammaproteobacteria bacterium]